MTTFTTTLLTSETIEEIKSYNNEALIDHANSEELVYLNAMTVAGTDFEKRDSLVLAFNDAVLSFCFNY